jgi:hypothetical protein
MATNRRLLNAFFGRNARKPALIFDAMEHLDGLFRLTDSGRYNLAPASAIDGRKLSSAISLACGRPVNKLQLVSINRPFPNPTGLSAEQYAYELQPLIWEAVKRALGPKFSVFLGPRLAELRPALGPTVWDELWLNLNSAVLNELWQHLRSNLGIGIDDSVEIGLHDSIRASLTVFLGCAMAGNDVGMSRLKDLVMLLPKALPLGEKRNEPGTWIVLVA